MSAPFVLLLAAAVACLNVGLHWYTQVATYPLFLTVPPAHFVAYHTAYQRRLPLAIYAPYGFALLTTALLLVVRPPTLDVGWVWLALALHGAVSGISLAPAVPLHARLGRDGQREALVRRLVHVNAWRLAAAVLASAVLVAGVARALRG